MRTPTKTIFATALFAIAWSAAIGVGLRTLVGYENTPGALGTVPQAWPAKSKIPRALDRPTLILLAHPQCPCTRATVDELAQILAQAQGKVSTYVLFWIPKGSPDWEDTELRRRAAAVPGVTVLSDPEGRESQLFGAETSGETLLFDPAGRLLFSGGITGSRGHAGDNVGQSDVVALLNGEKVEHPTTLVFGCPLRGHEQKGMQAPCPN